MTLPRWSVLFGLLLLAGSSLAGESQLQSIRARGRLVVLCFPNYDGAFSRPNLERGPTRRVGGREDFAGIDIELADSLARSLGVQLEIHTLEEPGYSPLLPALLAGEADLVISSLSITEKRKELVDFSDPYFSSYSLVVARKDAKIGGPTSLGKKRAVAIPGSSHEEYLRELGLGKEDLVPAEFTSEYLTALAENAADLAVVDSNTVDLDLKAFPELEVAFKLPKDDHYGIALPKGSDLLPVINEWLAGIKRSGELAEIFRRNPYR